MRRTFLYIVLFLQVMFMGHVQAQNGTVFPVDLNVTLTPPYGPCLDDYVGIGGNRFLCNVLFRDQMKDKTSPVFEYVIEMRVRTMGGSTMIKAWSEDHKAVLGAVEHFDGGRLMREFLSETNHTGGSTCLKEGPYTMTFRVYDAVSYNRGRGKGIPISQEFSFSVFVDKGAAPELFNPSNKERLSTTTQMVNFQWQLPYVASGMNTYKFVLAKIPQGGNANTDIDNPSYQIRNESVTFPMVQVPVTTLFGHEAQGDGSYAWQVTVCDAEGKQRTNYENQGKSKVFTFTFNDEVWLPDSFVTVAPFVKSINKNLDKLTIDSVEVDNETGAARWTNANLGDADTYHGSIIEVRKKGQDKWTPYIADELKSGDDEQQLPNLKKGVEYEARGQYYQTDNGDTVYAPYGEIVPFTVPSDIDTMNCADDLPALTDCGDAQPKEIHPGDTIIANGKRVFVDSVSYNGDRLSGSGHLDFPIIKFFKFRMQFKNIKVNCVGELVDGEITSVYDMTNAFILDLNNLTGKGNTGDETFNSTEPTVGKVKDLDNAKKTKQPGDYFEVEGEPNVIYSLDKDKNPVKIGTKLANWTSDTFTHANKMYNNEILLKFSNDRKDQGFDSSEEPYRLMAPSKYESVDGYWVPWLASNPGRVCVVKANLEGGSISNVKDPEHDVKFVMPLSDGGLMELNTQYNAGSGEFEITVMGSSKAGDKLEIYAVIKKTDGKNEEYVDAGRLYVPIYEYRTLKMTVVKVNGANASAVDKSSIESYLNEVYGRIGISFEVTVEEFQSEEAKEFLEDGLDVCDAGGFMTATTDEMRQLKRLYMDSKGGSVDEKRLYLFLVNKAQCTEEDSKIDPSAVCGDMPRNSKVGYLFAENTGDQASFNRTVAHELGHGAFTYEHPFDNAAYTVDQGTTHNLMDYVKDDDLAYFQWQSTLGLNLTWGFLEDDEDAMWCSDGHMYLLQYIGLCMGMTPREALIVGAYAENPDSHVFTEDQENFEIKTYGYGTIVIPKLKSGQSYERTTWLQGGNQQQFHALTEGTAGVEFAATTYSILKFSKNEKILENVNKNLSEFLLHRFGDCFAHMDISNGTIPAPPSLNKKSGITNEEANKLANRLLAAFDRFGTNVEEVKEILFSNNYTPEDIMLIYDKFGVKNYGSVGVAAIGNGTPLDLIGWLYKELDGFDYSDSERVSLWDKTRDLFTSCGFVWSEVEKAVKNNRVCDKNSARMFFKSSGYPKLTEYVSAIDKFIDEKFEFHRNGDRVGDISINGQTYVVGYTFPNSPSYYSLTYNSSKGLVLQKVYTNVSRDVVASKICQSIVTAKNMTDQIFTLKNLHRWIAEYLPKSIQNKYKMYGADALGSINTCAGHALDVKWRKNSPDDINRRSTLFKTYTKYVIELFMAMSENGMFENKLSEIDVETKVNVYSEIEQIVDWSYSINKTIGMDARLDGVFILLTEIKKANKKGEKEFYTFIPIKFLPQEEVDAVRKNLSKQLAPGKSKKIPIVMPGPLPIVTNYTWGDATEGLGEKLTSVAENTEDESYHEDADKQYQCMKDFFESNDKKMMNYFQIESVTRVFVDKDGNLIEENGKSDKVKSDMKNSEIENKVILFKVKMK